MTPEERKRRLYALAAEKLGMDYAQVDEVINRKFAGTPQTFADQYNALKQHTVARGGSLPSDPENMTMWQLQHSPVALHSAYPLSTPLEPFASADEGNIPYGGRQYPVGVLDLSIGYGQNAQGDYEFGIDNPAKVAKYWRGSGMQTTAEWTNLETQEASTLARVGTIPEKIQVASAWVAMTEFSPEGHAWIDPNIGQVQSMTMSRIPIPRNISNEMVNLGLTVAPEDSAYRGMTVAQLHVEARAQNIRGRSTMNKAALQEALRRTETLTLRQGDQPLVFFPGHKGMKPDRQYESSTIVQSGIYTDDTGIVHGEQEADRWLIVQKRNLVAQGTTTQIKTIFKGGASPMFGLQDKYGVQAVFHIRDPLLLAAANVSTMTKERQAEVFGREVPRWTDDLYPTWYEKVGKPASDIRTVTDQIYSKLDPNVQLMMTENQGTLTNVRDLGNDMIQADVNFYGMKLDVPIQPIVPWRGKGGGVGIEDLMFFKPEVRENLIQMSQGTLKTVQDMMGAWLANTETSSYVAEPISSFDILTAIASATARTEQLPGGLSGVEKGVFNEYLYDELAKSEAFKNKGVSFPQPFGKPDMILPHPESMRSAGGDASVIGRGYGAFRDYNTLLADTTRWNRGEMTDDEYAKSSAKAMESFTKAVSAQGFRKKLTGAPVGASDIGMRFSANPGIPENRYFMNSDLLAGFIKGSVPKEIDPHVWAKAMVRGDMEGPQANYMRYPFVNAEEQADTILGWWSYKDQLTLTPDMSLTEFEQIGASVNVSHTIEQGQNGDDDGDSQKVILGTVWESMKGIPRHIGNMISRRVAIDRAKNAPGAELSGTEKKIKAGALTVENMAAIDLRVANSVTGYSASNVINAFATTAEAKAGIARAHKPFIRDIPRRITGEDALSQSTRDVFRKPYMTVQDMGFLEGIEKEIVDLYHGLRGDSVSGIKERHEGPGEKHEYWRFGKSMDAFQGYMTTHLVEWESLTPEQAAVALGGTASGDKFEAIRDSVLAYRSAAAKPSEKATAIGRIVGLTGYIGQTSSQQPVIGAIYDRAMSSVKDKVGVMKDPNDPLSLWGVSQGIKDSVSRADVARRYLATFEKKAAGEILPGLWYEVAREALNEGYVQGPEAEILRNTLIQVGVDPDAPVSRQNAPVASPVTPGETGPSPQSRGTTDEEWGQIGGTPAQQASTSSSRIKSTNVKQAPAASPVTPGETGPSPQSEEAVDIEWERITTMDLNPAPVASPVIPSKKGPLPRSQADQDREWEQLTAPAAQQAPASSPHTGLRTPQEILGTSAKQAAPVASVYDDMTVAELRAEARDQNIPGRARMNKAALQDALRQAEVSRRQNALHQTGVGPTDPSTSGPTPVQNEELTPAQWDDIRAYTGEEGIDVGLPPARDGSSNAPFTGPLHVLSNEPLTPDQRDDIMAYTGGAGLAALEAEYPLYIKPTGGPGPASPGDEQPKLNRQQRKLNKNQIAVNQAMAMANAAVRDNYGDDSKGPMEGHVGVYADESGNISVRGKFSRQQTKLTERMEAIIKGLDQWEPLVKEAAAHQGELTERMKKIIPILGDYQEQLHQASGIQAYINKQAHDAKDVEGEVAGAMKAAMIRFGEGAFLDKARKPLADFTQLEEDVKLQNEMSAIAAAGEEGRTPFQNVKKALFGWTPMQMGRAWNMFGAPTFKKYIPAAGQEELAAFGLSQQIGGEADFPGGMAGGLLSYQAQMAANQGEAGRAGYRAWGTGIGAGISGAAQGAQAVFGPPVGAGLVAGLLLHSLGSMAIGGTTAAALATPVGLGIAGIGAMIAGGSYLSSFGEVNPANAFATEKGWGAIAGGISAGFRSSDAGFSNALAFNPEQTPYARFQVVGQAPRDRFPGEGQAPVFGEGQASYELDPTTGQAITNASLRERLYNTPLGDQTPEERTASIGAIAAGLREKGGYYGNLDPNAIIEQMGRGAIYDSQLATWTDQETIDAGGTDIMKLAQHGVFVDQYEDLSSVMMMGSEGPLALASAAPTQPQERRAWNATLGQYSALAAFGVSGEFIQEKVSSGEWGSMSQAEQLNMTQVLSGQSTPAEAQQLANTLGYAPVADLFTRQANGMPVGTQNVQGLGLGTRYRSSGSGFGRGQPAGSSTPPRGMKTMAAWDGLWGIEDELSEKNWEYSQAQMGLQAGALAQRRSYMEASWVLQDRGTALNRAQVVGGQGYQGSQAFTFQQNQLQDTNFGTNWDLTYEMFKVRTGFEGVERERNKEDMTRGYGRSLMERAWTQDAWALDQQQMGIQRGWQDVDFTQGQATNQREFGWRMEDYDMNIRFATGRDRTRLETGRERDVIRQNEATRDMGEDKERQDQQREWADQMQSTIEEHQAQKWAWEDEDYQRGLTRADEAKERNQVLIDLQDEQYQNQVKQHATMVELRDAQFAESKLAYEENYELQKEVTDLQRDNEEKSLVNAEAAADIAAKHAETVHNLNEDYKTMGRLMQLRQAELERWWKVFFGPEMASLISNRIRGIQTQRDNIYLGTE